VCVCRLKLGFAVQLFVFFVLICGAVGGGLAWHFAGGAPKIKASSCVLLCHHNPL
jgi:hypothetical protein